MAITFGHTTPQDRRAAATVRNTARGARTPAQQLAALDQRLGAGVGAARERAKLGKKAKKADKA